LVVASRSKILVVVPAFTMLLGLPFELVIAYRPFNEMDTTDFGILAPFLGGLLASPGYLYAWGTEARASDATWAERWWIRTSFVVALASALVASTNVMTSVWPVPLLALLSAAATAALFAVFELSRGR